MELEVKHLAPYLPYGLKLVFENGRQIIMKYLAHEDKNIYVSCLDGIGSYSVSDWGIKPILRPLSDLDKPIVTDKNLTVKPSIDFDLVKDEDGNWCDEFMADYGESPTAKVDVTQMNLWLFEYHFDVFGLIPAGLAIDINTLNK